MEFGVQKRCGDNILRFPSWPSFTLINVLINDLFKKCHESFRQSVIQLKNEKPNTVIYIWQEKHHNLSYNKLQKSISILIRISVLLRVFMRGELSPTYQGYLPPETSPPLSCFYDMIPLFLCFSDQLTHKLYWAWAAVKSVSQRTLECSGFSLEETQLRPMPVPHSAEARLDMDFSQKHKLLDIWLFFLLPLTWAEKES